MSTDKRALILRWIEEQEALCAKTTPGPWDAREQHVISLWAPLSELTRGEACRLVADCDSLLRSRLASDRANTAFVAASRSVLPLALAALRAETERHEQMPEWRNAEDKALGIELGCFCRGDGERPSWPCATIDRLFCSLGLQEEAE